MRAARFHGAGQPLRVERVPVPVPGAGEARVRVAACGICGTDVHFLAGHAPVAHTPITLGHEPAGTVDALGPDVTGYAPGARVVVRPGSECEVCHACKSGRPNICEASRVLGMHRDGGLAGFVLAPAASLVPIPDAVPFAQAAIVTDAVATPFHALIERGQLQPGENVAVFGAGGLGLHAVQLARIFGAKTVVAVDVRPSALALAKEAGADFAIDASDGRAARAVRDSTGGGADLALECVGTPGTVLDAVKSLRRGGRAVVVGMGAEALTLPPPNVFAWGENALIGSFGSTPESVASLLRLAANGRLDLSHSVSATFPLSQVNEALDLLASPKRPAARIVVTTEGAE